MASGGWLGHAVKSVVSAPFKIVGGVVNTLTGGGQQYSAPAPSSTQQVQVGAAPAPTLAEEAEYGSSVANQKKKRGKNSLYVSSSTSGSSSGGTGINV